MTWKRLSDEEVKAIEKDVYKGTKDFEKMLKKMQGRDPGHRYESSLQNEMA